MMAGVALLTLAIFAVLAIYGARQSLEERDIWSIGLLSPLRIADVKPGLGRAARRVLSAADVNDADAEFVADPFLHRTPGRWWLYFEVYNRATRRGEIACASSPDGERWTYERMVLREPFHLSYPSIFEVDGTHYMIPESAEAGAVRLYRAEPFPFEWRFVRDLLPGGWLDASVFHADDRWWMQATLDSRELRLFTAPAIEGPWTEHAASPVCRDPRFARPGGRVVRVDQRWVRFAQDGTSTYGRQLHAFEMLELTPDRYAERALADAPILDASGDGWNAHGMHHLDIATTESGTGIGVVDGKRLVTRFNWRKGVRAVVDRVRPPAGGPDADRRH